MESMPTRRPGSRLTPPQASPQFIQLPTKFICGTWKKQWLKRRSTRESHSDRCLTALPSLYTSAKLKLAAITCQLWRTLCGSRARAPGNSGGLTGRTGAISPDTCDSDGCSTEEETVSNAVFCLFASTFNRSMSKTGCGHCGKFATCMYSCLLALAHLDNIPSFSSISI